MPFFDAAARNWLMQRAGKLQLTGLSRKEGQMWRSRVMLSSIDWAQGSVDGHAAAVVCS